MSHLFNPTVTTTGDIYRWLENSASRTSTPNPNLTLVPSQSQTYSWSPFQSSFRPIFLKYKRIRENAYPLFKLPENAGYDLRSIETVIVPPRGTRVIHTGIQIEIPEGTYGRVAPRSSLAASKSIDVGAGVVDVGYQGEISVVLFNHSGEPYLVRIGDRIAQLLIIKLETVVPIEVGYSYTPDPIGTRPRFPRTAT